MRPACTSITLPPLMTFFGIFLRKFSIETVAPLSILLSEVTLGVCLIPGGRGEEGELLNFCPAPGKNL